MKRYRSLRRQLGFLYLSTGANGTGKTLFTLRDVRDLQLQTGRPVYYYGFTPKQPLHDFGWKPFEPDQWESLPDGSICVVDECQRPMPVRGTGRPPSWIEQIPEVHRKRGFDFFLITQHPMNFDAFLRRTISSPGWHRHFKRSTMANASNELRWTQVVDQPQKPNSGNSGEVRRREFPTEVFDWYESAVEHTAKRHIPRKLIYAVAGIIVLPLLIAFGVWRHFSSIGEISGASAPAAGATEQPKATEVVPAARYNRDEKKRVMTAGEYVEHYAARIPDLPHTAPAYDGLTTPKQVPYPAACISSSTRCNCYTQQATPLQISERLCRDIARVGFYVAWLDPQTGQQRVASSPSQQQPVKTAAAQPQTLTLKFD